MSHTVVQTFTIWHTDTLHVVWRFDDGTRFDEYMTVPPKDVRDARNAAGQVVDRTQENQSGQKM